MTIGNRISELRKAKGYTQEYVAEQLGVSRQAVSKWEQDQTSPSTDNLIALSKLLDARVEYLATGNGVEEAETQKEKKPDILGSVICADILVTAGLLILFIFGYLGILLGGICLIVGVSMRYQAWKDKKQLEKESEVSKDDHRNQDQ